MVRLPLWAAAAALLVLAPAGARSADLEDVRAAVGVAAEQTRLLFGRAGDLVRAQRGLADPGAVSANGLALQVDGKPVPLKAFDRFVPTEVKKHSKEAVGAFVTGRAKVAPEDSRGRGRLGIQTRGMTLGSDLKLGERSTAGVALGYASVPSAGGAVEAETLAVYGARVEGRLGLEWVAGAGRARIQDAAGGRDEGTIAFAGAGAHWDLKPAPGVGVLPWVRLDLAGADPEGAAAGAFAGGGLARVGAAAGVAAGYEVDVPWGRFRPHAALDLRQEIDAGSRVGKQAQVEGASAKALPATKPEASLRLGFVAEPRGGPSITVDGATERRAQGDKNHRVQAKVKMKF